MNVRKIAITAMLSVSLISWVLLAVGFSSQGWIGNMEYIAALTLFVVGNMLVRAAFKCPVCGTPVFYRKGFVAVSWPVKICQVCGTDLRTLHGQNT
jgi:hypothetical protein